MKIHRVWSLRNIAIRFCKHCKLLKIEQKIILPYMDCKVELPPDVSLFSTYFLMRKQWWGDPTWTFLKGSKVSEFLTAQHCGKVEEHHKMKQVTCLVLLHDTYICGKIILQCIEAVIALAYGWWYCCFFFCPTCRSDWILVTQTQGASFCRGTMVPLRTFLTRNVFWVLQIPCHLISEVI